MQQRTFAGSFGVPLAATAGVFAGAATALGAADVAADVVDAAAAACVVPGDTTLRAGSGGGALLVAGDGVDAAATAVEDEAGTDRLGTAGAVAAAGGDVGEVAGAAVAACRRTVGVEGAAAGAADSGTLAGRVHDVAPVVTFQ